MFSKLSYGARIGAYGLLLSLSATTTLAAPNPEPVNSTVNTDVVKAERKVLFLGVDGVQLEALQRVDTPNFDRLIIRKAYAGGITGTDSEQVTSSGPGWSTILTGVWANKHQITSNGSDLANPEFPSIFKRFRDSRPEAKIASVMNWGTPNTSYFRNDVTTNDVTLSGLSDEAVTEKGVELIRQGYDLVFLHLDEPDHAGHSSCFGSKYDKSLRSTDFLVGRLLDAAVQSNDDWLVLVTTDHGRQPVSGCGHGSQTMQEKTIFIGANKPLNAEFNTVVTELDNKDFSGIYGYPAQTSLTPTALRYLGVEAQNEWRLDGLPLLAGEGVRKLMPSQSGAYDMTWYADNDNHSNIEIYRDGQWLAEVDSQDRGWADIGDVQGIVDYVLVQNETPVALRLNKVKISAAISWNATRAHFFRSDNRYIRYAKVTDKADSGYPKAVDDTTWPGLGEYAGQLVASFSKDLGRSYYFLNDGRYIRYNNIVDQADEGYPRAVNDHTWPGLGDYAEEISATLRWTGDKVYFFLKNGQYLRYDLGDDRVDTGYPKPINDQTWPGLGVYAKDITAAVKWNNGRAYIFLKGQRYIRYNITSDQVESGYPAKVNNGSWPGLMTP